MCWISLVYAIVVAIVGELIRPKAKSNTGKPAGLGDFQFPTAEAGRVIPWLVGTVKILGPNTTASGGLRDEESYKRVKTGWFSSAKQSYGFRYYLTFQQILCGGEIDQVVGVQVTDKFLKVNSITDQGEYIDISVYDPSFFGDAKETGGLSGLIRVWKGSATQPVDTALQSVIAADEASAYRYVCHAVFHDFYIGMSTTPQPFQFIISRWPNTLGITGNKHIVNGTASNVICAAYDYLTDPIRMMNVSPTEVDQAAFLAAAATCYNESIGVNILLDGSTNGEDGLSSIMQYADGNIFQDPFTGLWTIKLARADYDVSTLIVLDESNSRMTQRTKTDWADTKNTIKVNYVDKNKNWTNQSVGVMDSGNLEATDGTVNSTELDYTGIDNADLANFIAERSRVALSTPFTQAQIEAQGIGNNLKLNDVFVASYPSKRITQMVMRVTDIEYSSDAEATVNISCLEDKYGVKYVAYVATPSTQWTPPNLEPLPALYQAAAELPYGMTLNLIAGGRYIYTAATRAGGVERGYEVVNSGTGAVLNEVDDLTPGGALVAALAIDGPVSGSTQATGLTIQAVVDAQDIESATQGDYVLGRSLLQIGDELIAFQNATTNADGTITFWPWQRAVYDTIPQAHQAGSPVLVLAGGLGLAQDSPFTADGAISLKFLMESGVETLAASSAVAIPITMKSRAQSPYLPGNFKINGNSFQSINSTSSISGNIVGTWNTRNAVTSGETIVGYTDNPITPDTSVYYGVKFYDANGNLIIQKTDMSGATFTAILNYTGLVRMIFYSGSSSYTSYFDYETSFNYAPPSGTTASSITAGTYTPAEYIIDGGSA